jgi:mono/diheme cytochrome c family protein/uncharacterized membrane protein
MLASLFFAAPAPVLAQADSSTSDQPRSEHSSPPSNGTTPAARDIFQRHCAKCHGKDGNGNPGRTSFPGIPNFTATSWQAQRSDAQLLTSILEGKGDDMPAFTQKIKEEPARGLVAHIRAFAPTNGKSGKEKQEKQDSSGFDERFGRLQKEMDELSSQSRELSQSSGSKPGKPSEPSPKKSDEPISNAAESSAVVDLFQKHCVKCHSEDGTGSQARDRLPEIPNFTDSAWQARRTEAQIKASILDGKGKEMPPTRGKVALKQAEELVAYVRSFATTEIEADPKENQKAISEYQPVTREQKEDAEAESSAGPPKQFIAKLIFWLGKLHPAAVHFPIALLTAAAAAEFLQWITGQRHFADISRFCVWFGTGTALVAGLLGWFVGSFRSTDVSGTLMTHGWLGASSVVCAGVVFVLSERSRRADHATMRTWFRFVLLLAAVLILVTGFFGGAVVFGLGHYGWPD